MNIRKGMFRMWIVASALFALGVGWASFDAIREEFRISRIDYDALAKQAGGWSVLPVDCGQARGLPPGLVMVPNPTMAAKPAEPPAAEGRWHPPAGSGAVANPTATENTQPAYYLNDGYCWYAVETFRRLYPAYKDVNDNDLSEKLYAKAGRPLQHTRPWRKVAEIAGVEFGTPLAVPVFGWSLTWVYSGFRGSTV